MRVILLAFCSFIFVPALTQTFTSVGSGNWNDGATWGNASPGTEGVDFPNFTNDQITVSATTTVTIPSGYTADADEIVVEGDAFLNIDGTLIVRDDLGDDLVVAEADFLTSFTNGTLNIHTGGTLENRGQFTTPPSNSIFSSNATYIHNQNGGIIPEVTWSNESLCVVNGVTNSAPAGLNQNFYHFEWDCPSQAATLFLGGNLTSVNGDFLVTDTGAGTTFLILSSPTVGETKVVNVSGNLQVQNSARLYFTPAGNYTINIGGDLVVNSTAGNFALLFTGTGTAIVNLSGNFIKNGGGTMNLSGNSGTGTLNVAGNFSAISGLVTETSTGSGSIVFNGTGLQTFVGGSTFSNTLNFIVNSNSILDLGNSALGGSGSFTSNGTVRLGSLSGSGAVQGNIPLPTRLFNSGSTIVYDGSGAQFMGSAQPSGSGINTIVDNASGVSLAADLTLGGNLTLASGNLDIAGRTLTMNGSVTPNTNFLVISPTSSLVINGTGPIGTLPFLGTEINNFTINRAGRTATLGSDLVVGGTLNIADGTLDFSNRSLTINGPYNSGATGSLQGNASSTLIIGNNPGGAITATSTFIGGTLGTFTLDRPVSLTANLTATTRVNLLQGTLSGGFTMGDGATFNRGTGTFTGTLSAPNGYNLEYTNSGPITTGAELLNPVTNFSKSGASNVELDQALVINGNLTIAEGSLTSASNDITLRGNFISTGGNTNFAGSTMIFDGNSTLSGGTTINFNHILIAGGATLNLGSASADIAGNLDHDNGGTMLGGTGLVRFNGTTVISSDKSNVPRFHNLEIAPGATVQFGCSSLDCGSSGDSDRYSIEVSGSWNSNNTGAIFDPDFARVIFNGTSQTLTMLSTHTFSTFELSGSSVLSLGQPLVTTDDIVIGTGTTLNTSGANHSITCGDDFIVNGTFVPNQGTVVFNGSSTQSINRVAGSGAVTIPFFNIHVNKASAAFNIESTIPNTTVLVRNEFRILQNSSAATDVDFDGPANTGVLVLASVASSTARIPAIPAGVAVAGNLTVRRYIQNNDGAKAWRYLAPSVVGASVADWQGEIPISGQFSNPTLGAGLVPTTPSMYTWNEQTGVYDPYPNNSALPASSFPLANGTGYSIYLVNPGNPTLDVRGTLRVGDVSVNLTNSGPNFTGYNLVGNPYPAPLDWDAITLPAGVSPVLSLKDNVGNGGIGGGYVYYTQTGLSVGTFDGYIAPGQAFWVYTDNATTLTFSESHKADVVNPTLIRRREIADLLRVRVEGSTGRRDEMVVYFRDGATDGFDRDFDAAKLENDFLNLFSYRQGEQSIEKYAINALGGIDCSREILLGLEKFTPGAYTLSFADLGSFQDPQLRFTLIDNYVGKSVTVTDTTAYEFQVTADEGSNGFERFKVNISRQEIKSTLSTIGSEGCDIGEARVTIEGTESHVTYQPYFNGAAAGDAVIGNGSSLQLSLDKDTFTEAGSYEIAVKAFDQCNEVFLDQKATVEIVDPAPLELRADGNTLSSNYSGGAQQWFLDGVEIPGATSNEFLASESGLYSVTVTTQQGCVLSGEMQFLVTGVETSFRDSDIRVFPNPFDGIFQVEIETNDPAEVKIFNTLGEYVTGKPLTGSSRVKSASFDLSGNSNGVYVMYVRVADAIRHVKIIKGKD